MGFDTLRAEPHQGIDGVYGAEVREVHRVGAIPRLRDLVHFEDPADEELF